MGSFTDWLEQAAANAIAQIQAGGVGDPDPTDKPDDDTSGIAGHEPRDIPEPPIGYRTYWDEDAWAWLPVDDDPAGPPKFSSDTPESIWEYGQTQMWLHDTYGIDDVDAGRYTNAYAQTIYDNTGEWPDLAQLYNDPDFRLGAARVATGANRLPDYFWVQDPEGNRTLYDNRSIVGAVPIESPTGDIYSSAIRDLTTHEGTVLMAPTGIPTYSDTEINALFNPQPVRPPGGGARGPVFDRDLAIENITNTWRNLLLEEPDNAGALAGAYITEATAFARRGGRLDLETWTRKKVRASGRYALLYGKKPESMSEDQYVGQYRQTVGQFGLGERPALRETEAGMTSGAGLAGFSERVGGGREAMLTQGGSWSQKFAASVNSLGALGRLN